MCTTKVKEYCIALNLRIGHGYHMILPVGCITSVGLFGAISAGTSAHVDWRFAWESPSNMAKWVSITVDASGFEAVWKWCLRLDDNEDNLPRACGKQSGSAWTCRFHEQSFGHVDSELWSTESLKGMHQILCIVKTSIWELEEANDLPRTTGNALGSSICLQVNSNLYNTLSKWSSLGAAVDIILLLADGCRRISSL